MLRGLVLSGIALLLLVMLAPTLRSWMAQRAQLEQTQALIETKQKSVADLQKQLAQWNDPTFIEQEARKRLKLVKVGERAYFVVGSGSAANETGGTTGGTTTPPNGGKVATGNANEPWYGQVWQSIQVADKPSASAVTPGTTGTTPTTPTTPSVTPSTPTKSSPTPAGSSR